MMTGRSNATAFLRSVRPARPGHQPEQEERERGYVPAAAGIGNEKVLARAAAARGETVERASRNAPQIKYTDAMNQPISGCFSKDVVQPTNAMHQKSRPAPKK